MTSLFRSQFNREPSAKERAFAANVAERAADAMYQFGLPYDRAREIALAQLNEPSLRSFRIAMYVIQDTLRAAPSTPALRAVAKSLRKRVNMADLVILEELGL